MCNIQRPRALERCVISDLSLGVSRSLSAASCVTIRSTYLEKLESFDSFLQGLSHLFQSIILGSHQSSGDMIMESTKDWKHEPEPEELVAEDATLKNIWKQEEYISLGRSLIIQDTLTIIQATPPSS